MGLFRRIKRDVQVVFERDPAAKNILEVIFCYPGFHAILDVYKRQHLFCETEPHFFLKNPA